VITEAVVSELPEKKQKESMPPMSEDY